MARKHKPKEDRLEKVIAVLFTERDFKSILVKASSAGIDPSAYVRLCTRKNLGNTQLQLDIFSKS